MSLDKDLLKQLMDSFREELTERLAAINAGLLTLEQNPDPAQRDAILEELFRHVHSLKGAARAVDLKSIEQLAHGMEDVFGAAKRGSISLTPQLFDLLYQGLDLINAVMAALDTAQPLDPALDLPAFLVQLAQAWRTQPVQPPVVPPEPTPPEPTRPPSPFEPSFQPWTGETIRVPTSRLDDLMAGTGELLVARLRAAQQLEQIKDLLAFLNRWRRDWQQIRSPALKFLQLADDGTSASLLTFLDQNEAHLRSLNDRLSLHLRQLSDDLVKLSLVTDELEDGVRQARMLPLSTLLGSFRRVVRDLAREKGVEVSFDVSGADTEMDKLVLEQLKDPLMHLLRNCIDHGIEAPDRRQQLGKPRRGSISLSAQRHGNSILISVSDDGAGIDIPAVRRAALHCGLLSSDDPSIPHDQILPLIFSPGLSTSSIITEVSGRGIGLDVVRRNIESLQGRVEVLSLPGQGTTFSLSLPLTLISTHCLLVRAAGHAFALPLSAVERIIPVRPSDLTSIEGKLAISHLGHPLALVTLADILDLPDAQPSLADRDKAPAVILSAAGQRVAFLIDQLLDEQEVVVKSLGKQLARVPNVAGATVLGTGQIVLILNVLDLLKSAQRSPGPTHPAELPQPTAAAARKVILIVDDSITTRTLEKNILTTAGYEVHLATDGQEALAALAERTFDLIVSDIDMPRMDGFELTQHLKQHEDLRHLPVILVTSMGSAEDKAQGIAVGADAYIIKSTFDQDNLLETIRQLI